MSIAAAQAFRAELNESPAVREEFLRALEQNPGSASAFARSHGFDCDASDLAQEFDAARQNPQTAFEREMAARYQDPAELSEEELEMVSGGGNPGSQDGAPAQTRQSKSQV